MDAGNLKVSLDLDAPGFFATVQRAGRAIKTLKVDMDQAAVSAGRVEGAVDGMGRGFRETILTLGAFRFLMMDIDDIVLRIPKSIAKTTGEFQRLQTMFEGLSKATDDATRRLEGFRDMQSVVSMAKNAPFEVTAIADAFVKFKTAGLDPTNGSLKALIDGVAKAGGSSEVLKRASVAIQQMAGKGVVSMEELRQQLGEAVPNAMQLMADGMGLSMQELTKRVSKGTVEARTALAKMFAQMKLDADGQAEKMLSTLPGSIERLKTEFELFKAEIGNQGFATVLQGAANSLTEFFRSAEGKSLALELGKDLREITAGVVSLGKAAYENADAIGNLFQGLLYLYGGSKLTSALAGIREIYRENAVAAQKESAAKKAAIDQDIANLQRRNAEHKASIEENIKDQEARRNAVVAMGDAEVDKHRKTMQAAKAAQRADIARLEELVRMEKQLDDERARMMNSAQRSALTGPGQAKPVVDAAQYESIRQRTVAISAEADAIARRQVVHERDIATAGRGIRAAQEARQNNLAVVQSMDGMNKAHVQAIANNERQIAQMGALRSGAGAAMGAIGGFAKSLVVSLGAAGAFMLAIEGIIWAFSKMSESARQAEEDSARAMRAKNNQGTQTDLESNLTRLQKQSEELEKLREQYQKFSNVNPLMDQPGEGGKRVRFTESKQAQAMLERMATLTTQVNTLVAERAKLAKTVETSNRESAVGAKMMEFEEDLKRASGAQGFTDRYREIKSGKGDQKELVKLQVDEARFVRDFWANLLNARKAETDKAQTEQERQETAAIRKMAQSSADTYKLISGENKYMGSDKAQKEKKSPIEEFIQRQGESIDKAAAEADRAFAKVVSVADVYAAAMEYVQERVKNGELNDFDKKKPGAEKIAEAANKLAQAQLAKLGQPELAKLRNFTDGLQPEMERLDDILSMGKGAGADTTSLRMERLINQVERFSEVLRPQLAAAGQSYDGFLQKLRTDVAEVGAKKAMVELADDIRQLESSVIRDSVARTKKEVADKIAIRTREIEARIAALRAMAGGEYAHAEEIKRLHDDLAKYIRLTSEKTTQDLESPLQKMAYEWSEGFKSLQSVAANWSNGFVDTLVDGLAAGKIEFSDFVKSVVVDIAKIKMKENFAGVIGGQGDGAIGALGKMLGLGGEGSSVPRGAGGALLVQDVTKTGVDPVKTAIDEATAKEGSWMDSLKAKLSEGMEGIWGRLKELGGTFMSGINTLMNALLSTGGGDDYSWVETIVGFFTGGSGGSAGAASSPDYSFAGGGVMTGRGPRRLRSYGIARQHTTAEYAEGDIPEAVIPLPDGRSVPVSMTGAGGGGGSGGANVSINVINQTDTPVNAKQGQTRFDGRKMVLDVVLTAMATPGPFRDSARAALR